MLETPAFQITGPVDWASVVGVSLSADYHLEYEYGHRREARGAYHLWRTDARVQVGMDRVRDNAHGRIAIEAFTALRLDHVAQAAEAHAARIRDGVAPPVPVPLRGLRGGRDLERFVLAFGPIGVGWSSAYPVRNGFAERLERDLADAKGELLALGLGHEPVKRRTPQRYRDWHVSFEGWAQNLWGGAPEVTETRGDHSREWLGNVARFQKELKEYLELAGLLARVDRAVDDDERADLRAAVCAVVLRPWHGRMKGLKLDGRTRWRRVVPDVPEQVGVVELESDGARVPDEDGQLLAHLEAGHPIHGTDACSLPAQTIRQEVPWPVDWELLGRMTLAGEIGRHLQWAHPYVDVDDRGSLSVQWGARSLVDVMIVQLMEHVMERPPRVGDVRRPYWPVRTCDHCGGAIVARKRGRNMRELGGARDNRWHSGACAKNGGEAERRGARRRELVGSSEERPSG